MSLATDLQARLQAALLIDGITTWPSVIGVVHDKTDKLVTITDAGGFEPETPSSAGTIGDSAMKRPQAQVSVRGDPWGMEAALAKAVAIWNDLHSGIVQEVVGTTRYMRIKALVPAPVMAGLDERHRPIVTASYEAVLDV